MEDLGEFTIEKDEDGKPFIACDEEVAEALEGAFIDWVHRGYMEPLHIRDGRLTYRLTEWGKEHITDILKVKGE